MFDKASLNSYISYSSPLHQAAPPLCRALNNRRFCLIQIFTLLAVDSPNQPLPHKVDHSQNTHCLQTSLTSDKSLPVYSACHTGALIYEWSTVDV